MRPVLAAIAVCAVLAAWWIFSDRSPGRPTTLVELADDAAANVDTDSTTVSQTETAARVGATSEVPTTSRVATATLTITVLDESGTALRSGGVAIHLVSTGTKRLIGREHVRAGQSRVVVPARRELEIVAIDHERKQRLRMAPLKPGEERSLMMRFEKPARRVHLTLLEVDGTKAAARIYSVQLSRTGEGGSAYLKKFGIRADENALLVVPLIDSVPRVDAWTLLVTDWKETRDRIWRIDRFTAPGPGTTDLGARRPIAHPCIVRGKVVDLAGKPIADLPVSLTSRHSTQVDTLFGPTITTDEAGSFVFRPGSLASKFVITGQTYRRRYALYDDPMRDFVFRREIPRRRQSLLFRVPRGVDLEAEILNCSWSRLVEEGHVVVASGPDSATRIARLEKSSVDQRRIKFVFPWLTRGDWTLELARVGRASNLLKDRRIIRRIHVEHDNSRTLAPIDFGKLLPPSKPKQTPATGGR